MKNPLFEKYDVPGPRYTSYPTVPYWERTPSRDEWLNDLRMAAASADLTWSLYLHLPYCESRCWFCACNANGMKDHAVEAPYVTALLRELDLYLEAVPMLKQRTLQQLHLGGGTPTFFSVESLDALLTGIRRRVSISPHGLDASVEVNPCYTDPEQITLFARHGFRRISFGVQDFNPKVQEAIHRVQSPVETGQLLALTRAAGFESVNFDLIYGLPYQTAETMAETAATTLVLKPDRIALYSFALVPWIQPAHRKLAESAPQGENKRTLYEVCRAAFLQAGYIEIGMDHFALPTDGLARAAHDGTLHRNFMGYTDYHTTILLGLGASSISESPGCYHQNVKDVGAYLKAIAEGGLATLRGHVMTDEDRCRRRQILSLMTRFSVELEQEQQCQEISQRLASLIGDGLVTLTGRRLSISPQGRPFLRNACMAFDARMLRKEPQTRIFSQTV